MLFISNLIIFISWYKYKNFSQIIAIYAISAILFSFSLQPVITQVAQHRTGKEIAQVVNTLKTKDTLIISYKDYLQDLPFIQNSALPFMII